MHLIVLTRPDFFAGETQAVCRLFDAGLERLHLRKPEADEAELAAWIGEIPEGMRRRVVVHDHFGLARCFGLGGIHLNGRNPVPPDWLARPRFSLSRSCHTLCELRRYAPTCDYVTLSPVFDSISKSGYKAAFSDAELREAMGNGLLYNNVYALGGVSFDKLHLVGEMGFAGAAMLGAVWDDVDGAVSQLRLRSTQSGR